MGILEFAVFNVQFLIAQPARRREPKRYSSLALSLAAFCFAGSAASSAQAEKEKAPAPAPPAASTNALGSFRVKPGFRLELVAAEPLVVAPVAMAFDETGRLFVVERDAGSARLGRLRLLDDTDGDGIFDASTVYADNLAWPSAVACYNGGVFVAVASNILYLKDTQGTGIADGRKTVLAGFGGDKPFNDQALLTSFNWGLDHRIHGATAGLDGLITASNWPGPGSLPLAGCDLSFDPRSLAVAREAGPAQSGLTFDDRGRKFLCDFVRPLRLAMYEPRYTARNPFFPPAPELSDVASPAQPIFRFVSVPIPAGAGLSATNRAALPVARTTNILAANWSGDTRGCVVYRGNAFPPGYLGNVFTAHPDAHAIHRAVLRENGLELAADRAPDERNTEFLVSQDSSFSPVQLVNGPDGALYVADRQGGADRGRIYRLVPADFKQPKLPQIGDSNTYVLVATLAHPNGWQRDTAARLLFERRDSAAAPLLANMLAFSRLPIARLHALHALDGLAALKEPHLLTALGDADETVRQHAILLSERLIANGLVSDPLWARLKLAAADPSLRVRYQLAFTLGEVRRPDRAPVLADILRRDLLNPWMQNAVLSSLAEDAGTIFVGLAGDFRFLSDPTGLEFLRQLATMLGVKGRLDEVNQVLAFLENSRLDPRQSFTLLGALGEGLHQSRSSLALVDTQGRLQRFYARALDVAVDQTAPELMRVEAIRLLGVSPFAFTEPGEWLLRLCGPRQPQTVQSAAMTTLARYNDPRLMTSLLAGWQRLDPSLRQPVLSALLARIDRVPVVLSAIEDGRIAPADLSSTQLNFLRASRDPVISARALKLFGPTPIRRPELVLRFKPALRLQGVAARGRPVFLARCAFCHQFGGEGRLFGPDLTPARALGKEKILAANLEPNAEVASDCAAAVLVTQEGENLIGIREHENQTTFTLRQPGGIRTVWPRLNVLALQTQPWSLMPEGLEHGLSLQDIADLLDFLLTAPR